MVKCISISILGAGSYGIALAIALSRNGHTVSLWDYNSVRLALLQKERCSRELFPDIPFPPKLLLEPSLKKVINASSDLLIVVPSYAFSDMLLQIRPYLHTNSRIVWATKGLESDTGRLLKDVAREIVGEDIPLAVISGPTFSRELAQGLPAAITLASTDKEFADDLQRKLHCKNNFRIYKTADFTGVQLGGVVKNIISIGAGISDGIGFGANARTALITRGLAEMSRLGIAIGASPATFMGMAGLGDLVLTCTDNQSRNRRFGIILGEGKDVSTARSIIGQVIEGYRNTKEVRILARRFGVEMPIVEQVYQILYCNSSVHKAALNLLNRSMKDEDSDYIGI
jgi:glycerol-3-phosphate dehydrogenase (NAD(P)+)